MQRPRIVISVEGGQVQDVFCSDPNAQVILVDWDPEPDPQTARNGFVPGQHRSAPFVGAFATRPFSDFANTVERIVFQEAQESGVIEDVAFVVS